MPSIREYHTVVKDLELPVGDRLLVVQTPLRADGTRPDVGWVTTITIRDRRTSDANARIAKVERVTTFVAHAPGGLRRKLRNRPRTTEKCLLYPSRTDYSTWTWWGHAWTSAASSTPGLSFRPADLLPLVRGCVEVGEGRPLVDWLVENATEVAPFLTEAGWLPATQEEFDSVRAERNEKVHAQDDEDEDDGGWEDDEYDDNPDHDRWR